MTDALIIFAIVVTTFTNGALACGLMTFLFVKWRLKVLACMSAITSIILFKPAMYLVAVFVLIMAFYLVSEWDLR